MKYKYLLAFILSLISLNLHSFVVSAESSGTFEWGRDNWSFRNGSVYFKDRYKDNLLPEHQVLLKQNLSHVDYRIVERILDDAWQGGCYGFAASSMLACYDIFNPYEWIDPVYESSGSAHQVTGDLFSLNYLASGHLSDMEGTIFDASVLTYYQMLQATRPIREQSVTQQSLTNTERLQTLLELVTAHRPVLICYDGYFYGKDYVSAHGVLAYAKEEGDWEFDGQHYNVRILTYDSNNADPSMHPGGQANWQYCCDMQDIYCNTETMDWRIPYYQLTQDKAVLCVMVSDPALVNYGGIFSGTDTPLFTHTDVLTANLLFSNADVHRVLWDGQDWTPIAGESEITHPPMFYPDCDALVEENFICPGDSTGYQLELEQPQDLYACIYYHDSMLTGRAANGKRISFDPSGIVEVNGDTGAFEAELVFNQDYVTDWYDVTARGSAAEALLQMTPNGYLLTADDLHSTDFIARTCDERCAIRVNTQADAVLFTQTSSGTLAAAADTDGDGLYETSIPSVSLDALGDLDDSWEANAADASLILVASANAGLTGEDGLSDTQRIAADVDGNGEINAADASIVLVYTAQRGLGTFTGTMYDFIRTQEDAE